MRATPDDGYRYTLTRDVGGVLNWQRRVLWVLLNPSTATDDADDPTIRKCVGFTRLLGGSQLEVVNLFAVRATDPKHMLAHHDPVGTENDAHIKLAAAQADIVICGWGNLGLHLGRAQDVLGILRDSGLDVRALAVNKNGMAKHPLYVPYSCEPKTYTWAGK